MIAVGNMTQRSYDVRGGTRTVYELDCDDVGPSLLTATAVVSRAARANTAAPTAAA